MQRKRREEASGRGGSEEMFGWHENRTSMRPDKTRQREGRKLCGYVLVSQ